jgi:phosphoglycerate dehydrogenase-like enzyme
VIRRAYDHREIHILYSIGYATRNFVIWRFNGDSGLKNTPQETRVLVMHDEPDRYAQTLKEKFPDLPIEFCRDAAGRRDLAERFDPTVLFSWKSKQIPAAAQREVIARNAIRWVHVGGVGFDHLMPLSGVYRVTNSRGVLSTLMMETVLGAILMFNAGFPRYMNQQREKRWHILSRESLADKTLLVLGLGAIGRQVAHHGRQFGMRVLGMRRGSDPVAHVDRIVAREQLPEVLPDVHYLCVHVPLTDTTRGLLGAREFAHTRADAYLINTSRGGVVDEVALHDALLNQRLAGAYLDVFEREPLPPESPFWEMANVVVTPHAGDAVSDWELRFANFFADNLERWRSGEPLLSEVDVGAGY